MRNSFVNTILDACKERDDIFILSGDAGLGVFDQFKEERPDRFLNMGVAEQNTIGFAAGLAMTGYKVLVYNIIPFLLYRCYEQVRNDICYQKLPVVLVGVGSGVTYAPMGMTHYSIEDIGLARTLPNMTVISPCDPIEARLAARYALASANPLYVRLAKRGEPDVHTADNFDVLKPQVMIKGNKVAIVSHGSMMEEALSACKALNDEGIRPLLISLPTVQPLDMDTLVTLLDNIVTVIVVEEHFASCGLASIMTNIVRDRMLPFRIVAMGFPDEFVHAVNNTAGLRKKYGINAECIAGKVKSLWDGV